MGPLFDYGWDHPLTADYYERFCSAHTRYQEANEALVSAARITHGMHILDYGAGTGWTAETALRFIGDGQILCWEPAESMRAMGKSRTRDPRIKWLDAYPEPEDRFDRILWGSGFWQDPDWRSKSCALAQMLNPGGAFVFNSPSLYLGTPDEPGAGLDPLLLELTASLALPAAGPTPDSLASSPGEQIEHIEGALTDLGFSLERSTFRIRISQTCFRDWLKIPVMSNRMFPGLDALERSGKIDEAYKSVDAESWKWEGWTVWSAWKR